MKFYNSILVAQYLLAIARSKGVNLNVTKVQKMLYIIYGYCLSQAGARVLDEQPKAWPYGPVFPKTQKKVNYDNIILLSDPIFDEIKKDTQLTEILSSTIDIYSQYTASQLSDWSHEIEGPWYRTTKSPDFIWNMPIPDEFIVEYFSDFTSL